MRILQVLLIVTPFWLPAGAWAQRTPVLVELFTSQGCSSCPPADDLLAELAASPDVIALALHVDYWDYLGWKDKFGHAANTRRQYAYAKAARKRSVYTPQMIVQGVDRLIGSDAEQVWASVAAHQSLPAGADLSLDRDGDVLRIRLAPLDVAGTGPSEIYLVRFLDSEAVSIEGGENAGRRIDYRNIVTDWQPLAAWDGRSAAELDVALEGAENVAVIVQRERLGPVLSAAKLP